MSKRTRRRRRKQTSEQKRAEAPLTNEPWIKQRTGFTIIGVFSVAFAIFIIWQLTPVLGLGEALLWGIGYGLAIWGVFFLAYFFNRFVRRRKDPEN